MSRRSMAVAMSSGGRAGEGRNADTTERHWPEAPPLGSSRRPSLGRAPRTRTQFDAVPRIWETGSPAAVLSR